MARLTLGPLISDARGVVAGVVFSSWKGINYARKLVTPANPQTVAQMAVRNSLNPCIVLWRSLPSLLRAWLDKYAVDYAMSGYNRYISANRASEQADTVHELTPFTSQMDSAEGLALTPGATQMTVAWDVPSPSVSTYCDIFSRKNGSDEWVFDSQQEIDAGSKVVTGLSNDIEYEFQIVYKNFAGTIYGRSEAARDTPAA